MTYNLTWDHHSGGWSKCFDGKNYVGYDWKSSGSYHGGWWSCKGGDAKIFEVDFDKPVCDVSFDLDCVDFDFGKLDDYKIVAYGPDGEKLDVTVTQTKDGWGGGAVDSGTVTIEGPVSSIEIIQTEFGYEDYGIKIGEMTFECDDPHQEGDGIVSGTGGDDLIDVTYTGDPEGDMIDNNDALIGNVGSNDDIVVAGDGDDTVLAGEGDDEVYGNGGSDHLEGGDGNDILIGDDGGAYGDGAGAGTETQEVFKWSELDDKDGGHLSDGEKITSQTQDTGENTLTLTLETSYDNRFSTDQQKVHSIDTGELPGANPHSSLESELDHEGDSQTYTLEFDKDAENVSFRVNDIDFDSTVVVTAYDADGNEVPVDISAGSGVTLQDNDGVAGYETAVSNGGGAADTSPDYSGLVSIPGPVAKIVITHVQDGHSDSGVNVTDIYFDTITEGEGSGEAGDDVILGGAGDDYIEGNGGEDTLDGGEGADTVLGGDDADTIIGGAGDVVDGGAGGDDNDTLDLSIGDPFYLTDLEEDSNGNGWNGTVVYLDADGEPTGETMTFTEIENINGTPVNQLPVANDDLAEVDEDGSVTIPVLANDSDPDGGTLTVESADADNGTVTVNADGTITYEPNANFNGTDTITYEVSDGQGGTDTATVTVTVNPVNDDPEANDDLAEVDEGESVNIPVLENDTDVDGDTLTVSDASAENGSVTINGDGTITYTPDDGFTGEDTITYEVSDGQGGTDTATVTVTVNDVNEDPDAKDDVASGDILNSVTVNVLENDTDADGDTLTIDSITQPAEGGTVVDNGDGTVTFTPDGTVDGDVTFEYTVSDGNGGFDTATVTLTLKDGIVEGTSGADVIDTSYTGDPEGDVVDGGDNIFGGNPDDDIIHAGAGDDIVIAGEGDDEVDGGEGNDTLDGGAGDDFIRGGGGNDTIDGGTGNDDIRGNTGDDTIDGGEGDDIIYGQGGNDTIDGGTGDDWIRGGKDADVIAGGDGNDTIDGMSGDDTLTGGEGDDYILGGGGNDYIDGGAGDDELIGHNNVDTIIGGDGNDTVDAGSGDDYIDTSGNIDAFGVSGSPDQGYPGIWAPDDNPNDDKDIVYGGAGNDTIITGDDDDYIEGGDGDDTIDAGFDDDTVLGGAGDDTIVGGEGNDIIDGGDGNDTIYGGLDPAFPDVLNIPDEEGDLRPDNGDDVIHGGAGNDTIYGQDDDDLIYGDEGDDIIDGGVDDDEIYGGTGNDTIIGGEGEDELYGDDDRDTFIGGNAGDHVDGGDGGDDFDTLDLTGSNVDYIEYTSPDKEDGIVHFEDGGTMTFEEIENVIPCFTPGTLIATPRGEVAVEELKVGDKVITRDNGIQEIRWLGRTDVDTVELLKRPALRPVRIAQGALDGNLPERDMLVSPQHRVLVASDRAALYFEEREVLVAAKHLMNGEGIAEAQDVASVTYIHFMFDQHEVVLSDGAWTESFQPGDYTLEGLDNEQREELLSLFPELKEKEGREGYTAARKTLKKHEALLLSE
ncbi:tandem-95 repeat protein [Oceanicola sp. D3]|uniref:Ig-like domain-containing protein n=1 Tax=Oceanicola sp. D3 TaxID=2587163 RepID=UPI00111E1541|nr:Ig-like domain-containing protein [Oceanicola sp. D3]QDC09586.1 tandem-95 repeat protein [Oceanicola sp. D3]